MKFLHILLLTAPLLVLSACSSPGAPKPDDPGDSSREAFDIDFVFGPGIADDQQEVFEDAAARWEQVITGDLPDTPLSKEEDACEQGDPAFEGTVDDLLIYVNAAPRDGSRGVLGAGGPCFTREGSSLPLYGTLELDSADLDEPTSLILHEIGHVLGLGLLWHDLELTRECPDDLRYFGEGAGEAWRALGGPGNLLVEDAPGAPDTQCVHWEGEVFGRELMTSQVKDGDDAPLSRLTVGALEDLGYEVDASAADAYRLPDTVRAAAHPARLEEVLLLPTWHVDEDGEVTRR